MNAESTINTFEIDKELQLKRAVTQLKRILRLKKLDVRKVAFGIFTE